MCPTLLGARCPELLKTLTLRNPVQWRDTLSANRSQEGQTPRGVYEAPTIKDQLCLVAVRGEVYRKFMSLKIQSRKERIRTK